MNEYKLQEKLTSKKIQHDIREGYVAGTVFFCVLAAILVVINVFDLIMLFDIASKEQKVGFDYFMMICLGVIVVVSVGMLCFCGFVVYIWLFGYKNFKIGIDRFEGTQIRFKGYIYSNENDLDDGYYYYYYLKFARFRRLGVHCRAWYYTWSENYKTLGSKLGHTFDKDQRVYVVLLGKITLYAYSDKMFDLSETLIRERLIDGAELLKQEKQDERSAEEQ